MEWTERETPMSDTDRVIELHKQFITANTHEDVEFLGGNSWQDVTWYNLNKSNYMSQDAILKLWRMLHEARPDKTKDATLSVSDELVTVVGDAAWVVYMLHVDYDFGDLRKITTGARATEIWRRADGEWKLAHFHCSEHEAGNMGGQ